MKKLIAVLLAVLVLVSLTACAGSKESGTEAPKPETTEAPAREVTPAEVEAAIAAAIGEGYNATVDVPEEELWSCALRDADLSKLDSYVAKQSTVPSLYQDAVVVAKCRDAAYADELVVQFNAFFDQSVNYSGMYPMEPHKIVRGRIYKAGDLVMYIIAGKSADDDMDDSQRIELAEAEYAKIDAAIEDLLGYMPENLAVLPETEDEGGGAFGEYDGGAGVIDGDAPIVGG